MASGHHITIRPATPEDMHGVVSMIKELAAFHRQPANKVQMDVQTLINDGFNDPHPHFSCAIAENDVESVGFVLYYDTYSTWVGKTVFVEDLYVREQYRGMGAGKRLLQHVTRDALGRGALRVGWSALEWNSNAVEFYKKQGAEMSDDWRSFTLSKDAMVKLVQ